MKKTRILSVSAAALMLLSNCAGAYTVHLPDDLTVIRKQTFKDNLAMEKVVLPEGLEAIEAEAFAGSGLKGIYCADFSGIDIAPDAFDDRTYFHFPYAGGALSAVCGEYSQIDVYSYPLSQNLQDLNYSSSDTARLTVDADGLIAPIRSGSHEVVITDASGLSAALDVHVQKWADVHDHIAIAHRGASGYAPDNTIAAFKYASKLNADMIELDIRKTKDGKIICFHDAEIEYRGRDYTVSALTLEQMRIAKGDLCTLKEALDYIAGTDMLLQIEFKSSGIEEQVVKLVRQAGMEERTYYGSFTLSILKKIKSIDPSAKLVYITNLNSTVSSVLKNPENFPVDVLSVKCLLLTEKTIARLHLAGVQVYGWTIDKASDIKNYSNLGLDGVITNFPDRV